MGKVTEDNVLIKLTIKQKDMVYCLPVHTWMVKLLSDEQNNGDGMGWWAQGSFRYIDNILVLVFTASSRALV